MAQLVYELHSVLERAAERPPYVLVGHSYGAWLVRAYQLVYPSEVAGMVLVESGANDPWRMMPNGSLVRSSELSTGRPVPPVKTSGPLSEADIPAAALAQMRSGLAQASATANEPPRDKLPVEAQRMRTWALGQLGHVAAAVNPFEYEELAWLRASRAGSAYPLADLPLVVLTRGLGDEDGPNAEELEAEHQRDQLTLVSLSRRGEQIKADRSRHHVPIDQPERVAEAVQRVLAMIRG